MQIKIKSAVAVLARPIAQELQLSWTQVLYVPREMLFAQLDTKTQIRSVCEGIPDTVNENHCHYEHGQSTK